MTIKNRISIKRIFFGVVIGGFFAALASVYFFFPATATNVFKNATAIVVNSWDDTFGGASGGYVSEIDLGASSTDLIAEGTSSVDHVSDAGQEIAITPDNESALQSSSPQNNAASPRDSMQEGSATATTTGTIVETAPPPQCAVATSANASRKLIFNEIAWMGSSPLAGETVSAAVNREWIELKNISGVVMDISHWQILDAAGKIKIVFDAGTSVPAGGLLLVARGEDSVAGVTADKTYSGVLSNVGGALAIFDDACNVSDVLDASSGWPAGNNTTKQTLERDTDGVGWHTSVAPGGTPKMENSIASRPAAAGTVAVAASTGNEGVAMVTTTTTTTATTTVATTTIATSTDSATTTVAATTTTDTAQSCTPSIDHLVIAEVQIAGAASTNDFVKIFNPTDAPVDIGGWKLRKKSKSGADYSLRVFPDGNIVASGGYFTWANAADGFGDSIGANVTSTETLAADNSAALLNASGTIIDAVAWGKGTNQYGEGAAYPTNPEAGQRLTRKSVNGAPVDTDNNADDFTL
ncbi:MAG: lamin tail domain-containing protein [Minisyncoccia bacterium]|jgi:hypothetical protein